MAATLRVCNATVGTWRSRFVAKRLDGLTDDPRPGAPRTVTDGRIEDVVTKTLETKPANATHWSTRTMAKTAGMSQSAVGRIWRAFGLKPHLHETFKLRIGPSRGSGATYRNVLDAIAVRRVANRPDWYEPR